MPYFNNPYQGMNQFNGYNIPNYQQQMQQQPQRQEIIHVNGAQGANAYQMAPNSNVLLLDDTAPIIWLAQTDGAGYKTVTPYDISPHHDQTVNVSDLEKRIKKLEDMFYEPDSSKAEQSK